MITVDTRAIALKVAVQMRAHQKSLAGKASDADRAHGALRRTAEAITTHGNEHADWAYTASEEWTGRSADGFDRRAGRVGKSLEVTADAAAQGATIVSSTHGALDAGHRAVTQLIDEYVGRASQVLDAGLKVTGAGSRAAIMTAVATVVELVGSYTKESAKHLGAVQTQMTDAAKRLAELERAVDHDGIADARRKPRRPDKGNDAPKTRSGVQNKIKKVAAGELGYAEGAGNRNKYGPQAAWCSSFATWVWRKSGVDIPILPFTGDVYHWGERHD
ncbi:MAG: CHAP domain-containing protein, partial [Actinomycetes bacterium]